jgi:hypothetical protein
MSESLREKIGAFFARDKEAYGWKLATDYEHSLSKISLSKLASELQRTQVRHETANTVIVEHMLAVRLARIQSRASWWSGWLGFSGAMLAAALTFYLGQLSTNRTPEIECALIQMPEKNSIQKSVQATVPTLKEKEIEPKAAKEKLRNPTEEQGRRVEKR